MVQQLVQETLILDCLYIAYMSCVSFLGPTAVRYRPETKRCGSKARSGKRQGPTRDVDDLTPRSVRHRRRTARRKGAAMILVVCTSRIRAAFCFSVRPLCGTDRKQRNCHTAAPGSDFVISPGYRPRYGTDRKRHLALCTPQDLLHLTTLSQFVDQLVQIPNFLR